MPIYNVHLYRELKLYYPGIEAETPEAAADIARGTSTGSAASIEDCEGADIYPYDHARAPSHREIIMHAKAYSRRD